MRLFIAAVLLSFTFASLAQEPRSALPSPEARFNAGMNALQGTGTSRNDLRAVDEIRSAAESGYAPAQTVLGYVYENGIILARTPTQAANWFRKAAESGDHIGQYALGRLYYLGSGVQSDMSEAQHWLGLAANQGDPFAQYLLGRVLESRDYTAAPASYRAAAEQGVPLAQYRLGLLLKNGRGVSIDESEAYVWLLLSYEAGVKAAAAPLGELEASLGSNRTEAAKTRARELATSVIRSVNAHGCEGWAGEFDEVPTVPPPESQKFCR